MPRRPFAVSVAFLLLGTGLASTRAADDLPPVSERRSCSVYIPGEHPNPARTVAEQVDLVQRMVGRHPDAFAMAHSADDLERAVKDGKIASLIGIEGGVAIEDDLAPLRTFTRPGARDTTRTHDKTLDRADAATDDPKHDGLTRSGEPE